MLFLFYFVFNRQLLKGRKVQFVTSKAMQNIVSKNKMANNLANAPLFVQSKKYILYFVTLQLNHCIINTVQNRIFRVHHCLQENLIAMIVSQGQQPTVIRKRCFTKISFDVIQFYVYLLIRLQLHNGKLIKKTQWNTRKICLSSLIYN